MYGDAMVGAVLTAYSASHSIRQQYHGSRAYEILPSRIKPSCPDDITRDKRAFAQTKLPGRGISQDQGSYLVVTLIVLGLISSCLGMTRVSTPFSNVASALSACTGRFSRSVRANAP